VHLFILDTTFLGGPVLRFVQGSEHDGPLSFGGQVYDPVDVKFDGLETQGVGALPTPTLQVSNADGVFQSVINTYGDLPGCTVHRIRTYRKFLDGQPDADGGAFFGPDTFRVERKATENNTIIEWELSAALDQEGKQVPGRQVIRETCIWRYRYFNKSSNQFDYAKAQCPYTGDAYFDINDQPVDDPAKDVPSRRLSCCKLRFGANNPLPFGGFPGVSRSVS